MSDGTQRPGPGEGGRAAGGQPQPQMRRQLLLMVVRAAAVSAVALGVYYRFDLPHAPASTQRLFTILWTLGNLGAVAPPLRQIRTIQRRLRADRSSPNVRGSGPAGGSGA